MILAMDPFCLLFSLPFILYMSHLLNQHKKRLVGLLDRAFIYVGNNSEVKVGRPTIHVGKLSWTYIEKLCNE